MKTRNVAPLLFLIVLCLPLADAGAASVTLTDPCARSISGTASDGSPPAVSGDPSGNISVPRFSSSAYTAGVGLCDALPADGRPICTISASQTRVNKNRSVTLYANCTMGTAQFTWSVPSGGPAPATNPGAANAIALTFPNAGAYSYSVAGISNASVGGVTSAPVTILVGDSTDVPTCVLTLSPVAVAQGGSSNANVVCQPEAASYAWDTADAGAPGAGNSNAATLTFPSAGIFTYRVAGRNAAGQSGPKAGAVVTVAATSMPPPFFVASSTQIVYGNNTPATMAYPVGTTTGDWVVLHVMGMNYVDTPPGWTYLAAYGGYYGNISYVFARRASGETSVAFIGSHAGAVMVAYRNVSAVGAVGSFSESSQQSSSFMTPGITPQSANSVVLGIAGDRDPYSPVPMAANGFTSRVSFVSEYHGFNLSERFFGSTAPTGTVWWSEQVGYPASGILIELKP